jgi:hypothetical protein
VQEMKGCNFILPRSKAGDMRGVCVVLDLAAAARASLLCCQTYDVLGCAADCIRMTQHCYSLSVMESA